MATALKPVGVVRVKREGREAVDDFAAVEEPLEVRLHGRAFAVIMRTPGADRELAAGFLFAEQVLRSLDDLGTVAHCDDTTTAGNVVNVTTTLAPDGLDRVLAARRQTTTNSSCGMCGRLTIESLQADAGPVAAGGTIDAGMVSLLPDRLLASQTVFGHTGGLHAAGLFSWSGDLETSAEDVGRHNAVDKVIGRMLLTDRLPLADRLLFVSGRTSFEIVQKALLAGIPAVASVSAPSTLAIDLAREAGITLVGFVRAGGFNIYSHPDRIA